MQFRTEINLFKSKWNFDYNSKIISLGSCFSSHMANKLNDLKFNIYNNPYGTFYNPLSILRSLAYQKSDFKNTCLQRDGMWVSYLSHSDIASKNENEIITRLESISNTVEQKIQSSDYIILTFGSAKIYTHQDSKLIVANCHKVPQNEFQSRILDLNEILSDFDRSFNYVKALNPNIKFILTVSPIRYLSDGFELNTLSKSVLIMACHEILKKYADIEYFPAYEMVMDDLRDYRFFEEDLLHPNSIAVDYVWNGFSQMYINQNTLELMNKVDRILKSLNHIPFNSESEGYKKLLLKLEKDIDLIKHKVPSDALLEKLNGLKPI